MQMLTLLFDNRRCARCEGITFLSGEGGGGTDESGSSEVAGVVFVRTDL